MIWLIMAHAAWLDTGLKHDSSCTCTAHTHSMNGCMEMARARSRVGHGQHPEEEQQLHLRSAAIKQHSLQPWQVLYNLDSVLHTAINLVDDCRSQKLPASLSVKLHEGSWEISWGEAYPALAIKIQWLGSAQVQHAIEGCIVS